VVERSRNQHSGSKNQKPEAWWLSVAETTAKEAETGLRKQDSGLRKQETGLRSKNLAPSEKLSIAYCQLRIVYRLLALFF